MINLKKKIVSLLSAMAMTMSILPSLPVSMFENAMTVSAASTVVWQGSATAYGWSSVALSGISNIPDAAAGGKLIIEASGSELQVAAPNGDTWRELNNGTPYAISGGRVTISLTSTDAQYLRSSTGINVNGDGVTVTKVTYVSPESSSTPSGSSGGNAGTLTGSGVVWEGSATPYGWSSIELSGAKIPAAVEGGILTIDATGSSQVQIGAPCGDVWTQLSSPDGNDAFDISGGKVRIVLSASNAQKIRNATALHVNGDGITVTKITYTEPSQESSSQGGNVTPPPSTGSYVVWQGTARPYGWSSVELTGDVTIPTNAEANGYLVINATGSSQVQIGAPAGDVWTQLSSDDGNDAFDITSGKVEIKLSSANAQKLRNATALHVNGDGITVTKITYYPAGTYTPTITSKPDSSSWGGGNNNSSSSKPDTPPVIPEPEGDVGTSEIGQSDFNDGKGLPWHICESMTGKMLFDISGGTYNLTIVNPGGTGNGGEDRWDCQFRHRGLTIEAYHKYRITYSLKTTKAGHIYAKLGSVVNPETVEFWHGDGKVLNMPTLPTTATKAEIESALINAAPTGETIDYGMGYENWKTVLIPANKWVTFAYEFIPTETEVGTCEFTFHMGGKGQYTPTECFPAGTEIQFDNMSLIDLTDSKTNWPIEEPYVRNGVLVNQVGYIAGLSKKATLIVDEGDMTPKTFKVIDATTGKTVYTGKSVPFGADKDSGDFVHTLDFSDLNTVKVVANQGNKDTGAYYITCDGKKSYKFNIGEKTSSATNPMYDGLLTDALNFFYQQRSSGPILSKYITSGDKTKLSRDVGFENDIAYIQDEWIASYPSEDAVITDRGTLDCTGGWFDAGDHGKYVVNGGISVWTLQNMYERELIVNGDASKFADGTMSIPENSNGLPDLLDEVRYQMDFMMKMQRTDGLVYHKMHDYKWTGLAVKPEDDPYTRIVKPVTTAATLNLAATAAQTARLWKGIDDAYATKCLNAAKKAYAAAKANPDLFAPVDQSIGGGPYGDTFVDDDFYWAACELYATTGDKAYHTDLKTYVNPDGHSNDRAFCITPTLASGENIDSKTTFTWGSTANLGTLSLLLNKSVLSSTELNSIKSTLMQAADLYLKIESEQGNGIPYLSTIFYDTFNCPDMEFFGYEWGSNSMVVNNAITMAYAADFATDSNKYANGVVTAMDYIFGRNAGEYSYVTGYGDHTTQYVHHRFWSGQLDGSLPFAPDGVLSGGCNSAMQDPWIKGAGYKVNEYPPQLCYLDHVEAWSVNECTINWNSPLAWVVNYLEDYDAGEVQPTPPVKDPDPESSIPDDSSEIEVTGDPALASISITLTGMIGANVSYFIPSKYINNSNYTIETIFQDTDSGAKVTVPFNANNYVFENGKKAYVFTLPIKPCNMQKDYMARLYIKNAADGSNATNVLRTSVVLANYVNAYVSSADPLKKAFGKALQTYGYYAQKQFNSADELPSITPLDLRDVTASTVADYQSDVRLYRGTKKAELSQTTLYLDSGTSIRTYLTDIASTVNTNNLYMKYTVDGVAEKVKVKKTSAGDYYGEIPDIPADKLSKMYNITFVEGDTQITDTVVYGAFSYIYATLQSTASANRKYLAKSLYKYSLAAEALLDSLPPVVNPTPDSSSSKPSSSSSKPSSSSSKPSSSSQGGSTTADGVIWEGNESINAWASVELTDYNLPVVKVGGVITVYGSPINAAKSCQVQIGTIQGANVWASLTDKAGNEAFDVVGGKAIIVLTQEHVDLLNNTSALHLNGTNLVATKMTYTSPENVDPTEVIWTGSESITEWTQDVSLNVAGIPLAQAGGKVIIEATAIGSVPQIQLSGSDVNWDWFDIKDPVTGEAYDLTGSSVEIVLTEETADILANSKKLFVKGCDVKVTKVTYVAPNSNPPSSSSSKPSSSSSKPSSSSSKPSSSSQGGSTSGSVIWTGNDALQWKSLELVSGSAVPGATAGGKLVFEGTATGSKPQVMLATTQGAKYDWTEIESGSPDGNAFDVDASGNLTVTLTAQQASLLASGNSLHALGQDYTLKKITYVPKGGVIPESSSSKPDSSSSKPDSSSQGGSTSGSVVWTGSESITAWSQSKEIDVANIPNAAANGTVRIYATALGSGPQIMLCGATASVDWWEIVDPVTGYAFDLQGDYIDITLSSTDASYLKNAIRIVLKGIDVKITKIEYYAPGAFGNGDATGDAVEFAASLGFGWNLGNTLDAEDGSGLNTETSWGQPKATAQLIQYVKSVGFQSIRIPVTWNKHVDSSYNIDSRWMSRVEEVVNYARDIDMKVIINVHHDCDEYYPTSGNYNNAKSFLTTVWKQIADNFADYDENLIFETMNEPRLIGTNKEWYFGSADSEGVDAIKTIVKLNQDAVNTIRSRSGYNKTRYIMCPSYAAAPEFTTHGSFSMPTDTIANRLIVSVHAYKPYDFAANGSASGSWDSSMVNQLGFMDQLYNKFTTKGYGIVIGEFGAINKNNDDDRCAWARDFTSKAKSLKMSCFLWDNDASGTGTETFGMINRRELSVRYPSFLNALKSAWA